MRTKSGGRTNLLLLRRASGVSLGAMAHRRARARLDLLRATVAALLAVCGCTERKSPGIDAQTTEAPAAAADASTAGDEKAARAAAEAWLALVDAGNNGQSFSEAAALFRGTLDQAGWERAVHGVRDPLGKVILANAQDGEILDDTAGRPGRTIRGAQVRHALRKEAGCNRDGHADQGTRWAMARFRILH